MITKKILDFDHQLSRIFGEFINPHEYDTRENLDGKYDIIFCHRDSVQDDFQSIKPYCNSDTKVIVDITTESGNLQIFLDKFKNLTDIEKFQFYLIVDTDLSNYKNQIDLKYIVLDGFDLVFYAFLNNSSDNFLDNKNEIFANKHGFLSLNNSCRIHRVVLLLNLIKRNISLENCSFLFSTGGPNGSKFDSNVYNDTINELHIDGLITDTDLSILKAIHVPINLDYDLNKHTYIINRINNVYSPIINLVTENVMGMTKGDISPYELITFTEKIIKPFLAKQIPLFIALPGLQTELRKMGFDLFDDVIDKTYESVIDGATKINLILDELEILLKMDLVEFKNKNSVRFQNNYDLLYTLSKSGENKIKSFLYDKILK